MISDKFWKYFQNQSTLKLFFFTAAAVLLLRLPTLFVEYYDIDVLTSFLNAKAYLSGLAYDENKGPFYHMILNFCLKISGGKETVFHFAGILIVILTSFLIYLFGKKIYGKSEGLLAAFFYGVYISAFNRQFLAINGEIVYNLFFILSFYFFYLFLFEKKRLFFFPLMISMVLAAGTKFQGIWAFLSLSVYFFLIHPFFIYEGKKKRNYFFAVFSVVLVFVIAIIVDWNKTGLVFNEKLKGKIGGFIGYITARDFSFLLFFRNLFHRVGILSFYHNLLWIFGVMKIIEILKAKRKDLKEIYLLSIVIFLFLSTFLTGDRLYFHYFVQIYPILAVFASKKILEILEKPKVKKRLFYLFLFPVLFFFLWNTKDALIKNLKPEWFYNEGKFLYYTRLVLANQDNDYLLPHPAYLKALEYLKKNSKPSDTVFAWPDGAEFIYFSGNRSATVNFWHSIGPINAILDFQKGKIKNTDGYQKEFIRVIQDIQADYFVDISMSPVVYLHRLKGLDNFPLVIGYLNSSHQYIGQFGIVRIWKKK
ncbi:MAG: hypothetical protein A2Y41_06965 [Spirochaetes bacterium GWB1_36_13]|nr:MAG: hypothetical protein A2Y41_06965 [Spirochaetes bacterium GWB1_36_13]